MKKTFTNIKYFLEISCFFLILSISITKTYIKKVFLRFRTKKIQHPHLQEFKKYKKGSKCNLNTLTDLLSGMDEQNLQISSFVRAQKTYQSKNQLITNIPEFKKGKKILAIPIAITAFTFFRHFVTIIIDKEEGIVEFYDPLGFSTAQYKNAVLWGPKCPKKDFLKLEELLLEVQRKYGIYHLKESTQTHQTDASSCALFVYDRIYKRGIKGFSFEKASAFPLSSIQV